MKGYVHIRVSAPNLERFLNVCAYHGIVFWNLSCHEQEYEMNVSLSDFFRMKEIRRKTQAKIRIEKKCGFPFFFRKKGRKLLLSVIAMVILSFFVFSRFIWDIRVEGNCYNSTQEILKFLETMEVSHGISKKKLDCARIAEGVRKNFQTVTWVSAKIEGCSLVLEVRENESYGKKEEKNPESSDLVSDKTGIIVSMITKTGRPLKKTGDVCQKGEVLVSGRLELCNDSKEIYRYEYTQADAEIYVKYDLEYYHEFPLVYQKNCYTGKTRTGYVLQWKDCRLLLRIRPRWDVYDTVTDVSQVRFMENLRLPLFYGTSTDRAYERKNARYTRQEAEEKAREKLQEVLLSLEEKGVQISENRVKIGIHDGVCTAKGRLTVIEKTGYPVWTETLEQPAERNADVNE